MCVFYFYLAACGPKGQGSGLPLPWRATALFEHPHYKTTSHPNHSGLNRGIPVSHPRIRPTKEKPVPSYRQEGNTQEEKTQPKAGLARPPTPLNSMRLPHLYPRPPLTWPPLPTPYIPPVCSPESAEHPPWPPPSKAILAPAPWGVPSGSPLRSSPTTF